MRVLILGSRAEIDLGALEVLRNDLMDLGCEVFIFKQDTALEPDGDLIELASDGVLRLRIDGGWHEAKGFDAYYLSHPIPPQEVRDMQPAELRPLHTAQFRMMREVLYAFGPWFSDPWAIQRAENKVRQTELVRCVGLQMPETLVTSDPNAVRRFYHEHGGEVVMKMLRMVPVNLNGVGHMVYTTVLTEEVLARIEGIRWAPGIFQRLIRKQFDLRVTIVGKRVFAARVNHYDDVNTRLDWRRKPAGEPVTFEQYDLPPEIVARLLALLRVLGLNYGAIDMCVDTQGSYWFLEVNPNGQWHFIQDATGLQISRAIAEEIVRVAS